ncbi:MAG: hypothetical protein V1744_00650 [Candidatus Altiarchaeota archaeon]
MRFPHILVAVIAVVLVCGCEFDFENSQLANTVEAAIKSKDPSKCKTLTDPMDKDNCYQLVSVGLKDAASCKSIRNKTITDTCYKGVAIVNKDYSPCDKIKDQKEKAMCMAQVATGQAGDAVNAIGNATEEQIQAAQPYIDKIKELIGKYT